MCAMSTPRASAQVEEVRLVAWTRRTDWPLTGLAVLFLVVYAWQVLDTAASHPVRMVQEIVIWGVWAAFALDYLTRFTLAINKGRFVGRHLFDLIVVLLPMARQLRVLRVLTVLNIFNRRAAATMRGRVGVYLGASIALICFCASLAVLDAERHNPDANITTFPDALWWTLTTITTVGYGDRYPTTIEGRLVAGVLMLGGIALLGVITGMVASWFVERIKGIEQSIDDHTQLQLREMRAELAALREQLELANGARQADEPPAGHRSAEPHRQTR